MNAETNLTGKEHPVWEVYDQWRTTRLNVKYYTKRLRRLERWSRNMDIAIAIGAPASAAAGFFLANLPQGDIVWKLFSSCTAIIAVVKPFLRFGEKIKKIEQALIAYRGLDFDLAQLAGEVRKTQQYSSAQQKQFKSATSKLKDLVVHPPGIDDDKKLKDALYWEVIQELPDTEFFIPGDNK